MPDDNIVAKCPDCGRVQMKELTHDSNYGVIRIVNSGRSYSFVPAGDVVVGCKKDCGYLGTWKKEQKKWETSISRDLP